MCMKHLAPDPDPQPQYISPFCFVYMHILTSSPCLWPFSGNVAHVSMSEIVIHIGWSMHLSMHIYHKSRIRQVILEVKNGIFCMKQFIFRGVAWSAHPVSMTSKLLTTEPILLKFGTLLDDHPSYLQAIFSSCVLKYGESPANIKLTISSSRVFWLH